MIKFTSELGSLADSLQLHEPIDIPQDYTKATLIDLLKTMLTIRFVETEIGHLIEEGTIKGPCHLGIGQEAIAVAIATQLRKTDHIFGTHRSHSHYIALEGSIHELFAEALGKVTGCAKGRGGSMHLIDKKNGFYGSVPIVGGTIPLAVGAALAAKMDKKGNVAVCFFGDGAAEQGVLHESFNLASTHKLPVLFVCENNLYSSHLDINLRQPSDRIARFATAHHIPHKVVDGNDIFAVLQATKELLEKLRLGEDAGFLEAVTYRWRGHVGPKEDIGVGVRRKLQDLVNWKKRDPISRLSRTMIEKGLLQESEFDQLSIEVQHFVLAEKTRALNDPYPAQSTLTDHVYSD